MSSISLSSDGTPQELSRSRQDKSDQPSQWEQQAYDPRERATLVLGEHDFTTVTDSIAGIALGKTPTMWYVAMSVSLSLLSLLVVTIGYLLLTGVGVWGNNNTVSWGFPIINFVFWVGIGHAGTLISAILFLLASKLADGYQPLCRSDDDFRRVLCGDFPRLARRSRMAGLLVIAVPE
jgi:hypothetical protein